MTAEGRVWEVVCAELQGQEYTLTVRAIARQTGLSVGAVHKTFAWRFYHRVRSYAQQ